MNIPPISYISMCLPLSGGSTCLKESGNKGKMLGNKRRDPTLEVTIKPVGCTEVKRILELKRGESKVKPSPPPHSFD